MAVGKKVNQAIQYLIFLSIAIVLFWFASRNFSFSEIMHYVKDAHYWPLVFLFIAGIFSHFVRAMRWKLLIKPLGYEVGLTNTFLAIMIGYLVNLATPRMGEIARCGLLSKYDNVPADKLAGTMIAERVFDLICLIILIFITYFVEYNTVNAYFQEHIFAPLLTIAPYKIGIFIGAVLLFFLLIFFVFKKLLKKENKFNGIVQNLISGFLSVKKLKQRNQFLILTFGIWFLYWAMAYIGFQCLDDLANLKPGAALSVLTFGSIGFVVTPGGTGSYQLIIKEVLSQLYHVPEIAGLAFSHISWAAQNLVLIIGGVISMTLLPILNTKKNG